MQIKIDNNIEKLKKHALEAIRTEQEAMKKLETVVDDSFGEVLACLASCPGKIMVSGVGKSAIVARKMCGTLVSTGTPALFIHATDALHGDLGLLGKDDVVLLMSKSGNTDEVKRVFQFVRKHGGNKIISMVSNKNSYLALNSDMVVYVPVEKEAEPVGAAPTVSTTLFMVMGDAIAMALAYRRGFTSEDFGRLHPGGSIGKRLYLKVEDVFDRTNLPKVSPDDELVKVILEMSSHRLGTVVVIGEDGSLAGIITDGDMRRMLEIKADLKGIRARDIMTDSPKTIDISDLAVNALSIMEKNKITAVVAMKDGKYAGIVHIHDIIKEGL